MYIQIVYNPPATELTLRRLNYWWVKSVLEGEPLKWGGVQPPISHSSPQKGTESTKGRLRVCSSKAWAGWAGLGWVGWVGWFSNLPRKLITNFRDALEGLFREEKDD